MGAIMQNRSWKAATKAELENYFRNRRSPRLVMTSVLMLTGIAGFALCHLMLWFGVLAMGIRYPLAAAGGYGVFLLLLRAWVAWEHHCFDHRAICLPEPPLDAKRALLLDETEPPRDSLASGRSDLGWLDWLDLGFDVADFGGCLFPFVLGLLLAIASVGVVAIADAPALIADVFLDSFLVSILYRNLRSPNTSRWLGKAVRRTLPRALWLAVLLALAGFLLQAFAPDCHSLGPAVRKILNLDS